VEWLKKKNTTQENKKANAPEIHLLSIGSTIFSLKRPGAFRHPFHMRSGFIRKIVLV